MNDNTSSRFEDESFIGTLEHLGIADALDGFIAPERVRIWGFLEVGRFAQEYSYRFVREGANVYGKLMLVPLEPTAPVLRLRVITRSDHAATYPSRRAA